MTDATKDARSTYQEWDTETKELIQDCLIKVDEAHKACLKLKVLGIPGLDPWIGFSLSPEAELYRYARLMQNPN